MTIHILTDSSHYLDPAVIADLDIHVLPLTLHLAGQDRRERLEITTEGLFEALKDRTAGWPTTAAVSPGALHDAYDELTANGDEIVGVFMSRGTSVTVENAEAAAAEHPNGDRIHVVDSLVVSGALALTLRVLAARRDEGMPAADLAARCPCDGRTHARDVHGRHARLPASRGSHERQPGARRVPLRHQAGAVAQRGPHRALEASTREEESRRYDAR